MFAVEFGVFVSPSELNSKIGKHNTPTFSSLENNSFICNKRTESVMIDNSIAQNNLTSIHQTHLLINLVYL